MENCPYCDAPGSYREATDGSCYVCGMMLPNLSGQQSAPNVATAVMEHRHEQEDTTPEIPETPKRDEPTVVVEPRSAPTVHMDSSQPPAIDLIHPRNLSPEYARRVTAAWQATKSPFKNPLETINSNTAPEGNADNLLIGTRSVSRSEEEGRADYRLKEIIGEGAMGTVWSARQGSLDREVALKMPKPYASESSFGRQLFISEVMVTGQLDHPNIVPIYDLARDEKGQLFYAMKRVEGRSWDACMHEASRTRHENVEILMKVCDAVRFAHDRKVIHRDIKPQNIMIGKFGEVSVMDWGIALRLPEGTQIPGMAKIAPSGTPAYMAPEMATGNANEIGWHTDVYLLGAVLYEIITGEPPHPAPSGTSDVFVQQKACLLIAARNVITPAKEKGELVDIAYKAMATDIYQRYATVDELQEAIRGYFEHAESIALTDRGDKHLTNAREAKNGVYEDFAKARFAYDEAVQLWPENTRARRGVSEATRDYAGSALERGDYALGLSLLKDDEPEHAELAKKLRSAKRKQNRNRFVASVSAIAAVLSLVTGLIVSLYFYANLVVAQGNATSAKEQQTIAEKATKKATEDARSAQEEVRIAEGMRDKATRDAAETERIANEKTTQADSRVKKAGEDVQKAQTQLLSVNDQLREATVKTSAAEAKVAQTTYSADIKRVADEIQTNSFDNAREALNQIQAADNARPEHLRNWEWGHLMYQAAEPTISRFPVAGLSRINSVAVSPDKKWFAAAADDKSIYVWRSGSNNAPASQKLAAKAADVVFSADGKTLAVAAGDTVSFYALAQDEQGSKLVAAGQSIRYVPESRDEGANAQPQIVSVAISPVNPDQVLTGTDDAKAQLWSRQKPAKPTRIFKHLLGPVWQARFSPDGTKIATAGDDGSVRLWNPASDDSRVLDAHRGSVYAIEFSPDGKSLASAGRDRRVLVWNVPTLDELRGNADTIKSRLQSAQDTTQSVGYRSLGEHTAAVRCLAFASDNKTLFSGSDDNSLSVWDTSPGSAEPLVKSLRGHGGQVRGCAAAEDGTVVSGSSDGKVFSWKWRAYAFPYVLRPDSTRQLRLTSAAASNDARWIATGAEDGQVTVWDMSKQLNPTPNKLVEGHDWQATTAMYFQNDQRLLTAGGDNSALVWDAKSGNQLMRFGGATALDGTGWRGVGAASRSGEWIATGSNDKNVLAKLWHARTGKPGPSLVDKDKIVSEENAYPEAAAIAFSPDSLTVFVGAQSGEGYLFSVADGSLIKKVSGHVRKINAAMFMLPDAAGGAANVNGGGIDVNQHLFTASSDGSVIEWNLQLGKDAPQVMRILKHGDRAVSLDLSKDRTTLITAADSQYDDTVLRLWDMKSSEPLLRVKLAEIVGPKRAAAVTRTGEPGETNQRPAIRSVALHPTQPQALVTVYDPKSSAYELHTWSWANNQSVVRQVSSGLRDTSMALYSPNQNGAILTVGGRGARVRLANQVINDFRPQGRVQSVAFSPNGELLASASEDGSIKLWRLDKTSADAPWKSDAKLLGHNRSVNSVSFHPKQNGVLLSTGDDGTVRLWRASGGTWAATTLQKSGGAAGPATQAIFAQLNENGSYEIFAATGDSVSVWSDDGKPLRSLLIKKPVQCLAVSPDGKWLVAGAANQALVYKRDAAGGEPLQILQGSSNINAITFSKDGDRLFTAGANRQVKVWDAKSWGADAKQTALHELLTLEQHTDSVVALANYPSAEKPALLSAGTDGQVILWRYLPWQ